MLWSHPHQPRNARRWSGLVGLLALLLTIACQPVTSPTIVPSPTTVPAGPPTTSPPAPPTSAPATAPTPSPSSPTPAAPTRPVPPSTASPPAGPAPTAAVKPSPPATATQPPTAEALQIEGRPLLQLVVAGEGRRYATTEAGLYALTGTQSERRASGLGWPYLVPVGPSTLLSGDYPACARGGDGTALRRSLDGGRTWQPVQVSGGRAPLEARPLSTLGADLFAAACDGFYRSVDSGATWSRLPILGLDHLVVDAATTPDGRRLYLATLFGEGGTTRLYASDRQADGWSPARLIRETWGGGVVTVGREEGNVTIYFGSPLGLESSRDGGTTWLRLSNGLESTILLADPRRAPLPPAEEAKLRRGVGIHSLAARLDRPRLLLGGLDGLYLLTDGRWQHLAPLANQLVREILFDLDGTAYARTDLGVFRLRGL